jgi:hypothetical protein
MIGKIPGMGHWRLYLMISAGDIWVLRVTPTILHLMIALSETISG